MADVVGVFAGFPRASVTCHAKLRQEELRRQFQRIAGKAVIARADLAAGKHVGSRTVVQHIVRAPGSSGGGEHVCAGGVRSADEDQTGKGQTKPTILAAGLEAAQSQPPEAWADPDSEPGRAAAARPEKRVGSGLVARQNAAG